MTSTLSQPVADLHPGHTHPRWCRRHDTVGLFDEVHVSDARVLQLAEHLDGDPARILVWIDQTADRGADGRWNVQPASVRIQFEQGGRGSLGPTLDEMAQLAQIVADLHALLDQSE